MALPRPSLSPLPPQNHAGLPAAPSPAGVRCVCAAGPLHMPLHSGAPLPGSLPPVCSAPSFSVKPALVTLWKKVVQRWPS